MHVLDCLLTATEEEDDDESEASASESENDAEMLDESLRSLVEDENNQNQVHGLGRCIRLF